MRQFLAVTVAIFVICLLTVFTHHVMAQTNVPSSAFVQQLMRDSKLVDQQWTWREIYPGRDSMETALSLLRRPSKDGFAKQMTVIEYESRVDWIKFDYPVWKGSILQDGAVSGSYVYSVIIRPPPGHVKLGDVLLIYGTPFNVPTSYGDSNSLCFAQGLCVTTQATPETTRMQPNDDVLWISYQSPRQIYESIAAATTWRGFRRY